MTRSLLSLSPQILLNISRKLAVRTLCRLRCASKIIDSFIERNRFHMVYCLNDDKFHLFVTFDRETRKPEFYVRKCNEWRILVIFRFGGNRPFFRVNRPFEQLSGASFDSVTFHSLFKLTTAEEEQIIPIIEKLRLQCFWLAIRNINIVEKIINLVDFRHFHAGGLKLQHSVVQKWPLWNCQEICLCDFSSTPPCLSDLLFNASSAGIEFKKEVNIFLILSEFFKIVKQDRTFRRQLRYLRINGNGTLDPLEMEGFKVIWKGNCGDSSRRRRSRPKSDYFYKMEIDGGVAIVYRNPLVYHIYFENEDTRENLLNCLSCHFFDHWPFDLSAVFDQFVTARCDQNVLKTINYLYF